MSDLDRWQLFIDGSYCAGGEGRLFDDINPATGQKVADVDEASADDVDRAVQAARRALDGPWAKLGPLERAQMLERVADGIDKRHDEFLRAEVQDTGKPLSLASRLDIPRGAANFRQFADLARGIAGETWEMQTADGRRALNYSLRRPVGVVGVICPWNLPLLLMTWKVAPALATGNTVVVKPSEETPATATLLAEVMRDAGIPDGVYNVVHGFGPGSAGEYLVRHPDVAAITFTGESRTGQAIMKDAAPGVKPLSFELGGKNAAIVFADADFDAAVAGTARSTFTNCGQVCLCSERVYVERSIFERFVEALKVKAEAITPGDPLSDETDMGPLVSAEHLEKVLSYFEIARDEGGTIVTGGGQPLLEGSAAEGFFVEPTIVTGLSDDARLNREEVFGPICHISPFDDEDEVIRRANDTEYGLAAAIWTRDVSRAHRVAEAMDVGISWVNCWYVRDLRTPFGGMKMSGIGREGGTHSLEFYTELKNVCIQL